MRLILILLFYISIVDCREYNNTIVWFNENHPWDSSANGNDIERFVLIRAKYPEVFEINPWTGLFQIRNASIQKITNRSMLIGSYSTINDGFICQSINGKPCVDYEIGFEVKYNPCSVSAYPPNETYIPGGQTMRPHAFPWHVSILYEENYVCDGTLIDNQHVLTSANCLHFNRIPMLYSIILGAHSLSNSTDRVPIDRFIYHSDFNLQTLQNNIGLIKLREPTQSFSDHVTSACLARSIQQPSGSYPLLVTSWNSMKNPTSKHTDELQQTILTLSDECSRIDQKFNFKKQLCLDRENVNNDLYRGGYGSGLFEKQLYDVERWILTGIGSHQYRTLAVYTRINAYYNWIQDTIEKMT